MKVTIQLFQLKDILKTTKPFVSKRDHKPLLQLLLDCKEGKLTAVAVDGFI